MYLILAGLQLLISVAQASKISNKNILLPVADTEVEYVITAEGDCFDWSSSSSAISVSGENPQDCSKSYGVVRVVSRQPSHSFIYVKSLADQFIVEVVVQQINSISIVTKQKLLDLDTQEELHIQAQDEKGNTFTTLEGLSFEWNVGHLELVKFADSGLKVSERRIHLEQNSDIIVVKGRRVGKVPVTAKIIEANYLGKQITTQVELTVIQKFQFQPDYPIYYLPTHSEIQFNLLRADGKTRIQLPSQSHKWSVSSQISSVNQNGIVKTNKIESNQKLKVINSTECQLEATYHVVDPKSLGIDIWEDGKDFKEAQVTHLVVGRLYRFQAYLKDSQGNRLYSSDKYEYSSDDIQLIQQTLNSPSQRNNVILQYTWKTLKANISLNFVLPLEIITVFKTYIHLPVKEPYELIIRGGSGVYGFQQKYISPNIFSLSQNNIMKSESIGENDLLVYDKNNIYNTLEVKVYVTDVTQIFPFEIRKELLINEPDFTYYQAVGHRKIGNYTQCRSVFFEINTIEGLRTNHKLPDQQENYLVCNGITLLSSQVGSHTLEVKTQTIRAAQYLRVYDHMHFEEPFYLISPYSTITTQILGGPQPWDQNRVKEILYEGIIRQNQEQYHFNCFQENAFFIISRQNRESQLLPNPKNITSKLPIRCILPDAFKVYNEQNQDINWLFKEDRVKVKIIAVKDNIRFYNSSSLALQHTTRGLLFEKDYLSYNLKQVISDCKFIVESDSYVYYPSNFKLIRTELDFYIYHTLKLIPNGPQYVQIDQEVQFIIESSTKNIHCTYGNQYITCNSDSVTVTPRQIGSYQLVVTDQSLNYSVQATLHVVDSKALNLQLSSQITVVGKSVNATNILRDGYDNQIYVTNWSALKLLDLSSTIYNDIKTNHMVLTPKYEGNYRIQSTYNGLISNAQELIVIEQLQIETVYMPTECETHVILPIHSQIIYSAESIPAVDVSVSAHVLTIKSKKQTGEFYIKLTLKQVHIIDITTITVIIDGPNQISLKYGRKIELGATIRIVADIFIRGHPMNLCLCPTHKLLWYQDDKIIQSAPNQLGLAVQAQQLGKIYIKLSAYQLQANTIVEVERLNAYTRNLFIGSQALYHIPLLIPPKSTLALDQDVKSVDQLKYKYPNIIESDGITLQPQQISAYTPMLISVEEIYQLYASSELVNLKVDEKYVLPISYLNTQGYQFENVEQSKFEVLAYTRGIVSVSIKKNTLEIYGLAEGYALIRLNCGINLNDYLLIKVGATLQKVKAYIGASVSYKIDEAESPIWYSNCGEFKQNKLTITQSQEECFVEVNDSGNKFRAQLDVIVPTGLTVDSIKNGQNIQIQLNVNPKLPQQNNINSNFNIKFEIEPKEWFEYEKSDQYLTYIIKPLNPENNQKMPTKFKLNVQISNKYYQLEATKDILFEREFIFTQKEIQIQKNDPTFLLKIPYYKNIEKTHQDSHLQGIITTSFNDGNVDIFFDFSQCHEPTEGYVYFENNQKIKVTFVDSSSFEGVIFIAAIIFFFLVLMQYLK